MQMGSPDQESPTVDRRQQRIEELEREVAALVSERERSKHYWGQLEAVLDNSPLAIYLKDARYAYLLVNREYERLAQRTRSEIIGRYDFDLFPEPVARLFREQDQEVVACNGPVEFKETIPLPDGVHSFITSKFPLSSSAGELCGVAGVCTDITALERAQRRLEEAEAEIIKREHLVTLGELSAAIAHEVRNPLAVVFNALASLKQARPSSRQSEELLRIIGEEASRLNRMVGGLLDLARPEEAKLAACAVEPLVTSAIDAARALADPSAVVRLDMPRPVPSARVDEQMLRLALLNLITNAIQAPQRQGPVRVSVDVEGVPGEVLRFQVVDDGAGVPLDLVGRIFKPFFTTRAMGSGLGLAVVRRIANAHQGTVSVSGTPGGGATFVLRVPLSSGPAAR